MKGLTHMKRSCLERQWAIKGHALGHNPFLPQPIPEIEQEDIARLVASSPSLVIPVQACRICDFKGDPRLSKEPTRSKAQAVQNLVGGWWKNPTL